MLEYVNFKKTSGFLKLTYFSFPTALRSMLKNSYGSLTLPDLIMEWYVRASLYYYDFLHVVFSPVWRPRAENAFYYVFKEKQKSKI